MTQTNIGHCAKELSLHIKWSELVNEEFYMQGDLERRNKSDFPNGPEPLWDREQSNLMPKNQANFIRIFITPFHNIVSELFPTMKYVKDLAATNFSYWNLFDDKVDDKQKKLNKNKRELMYESSRKKLSSNTTDESVTSVWRGSTMHMRKQSQSRQFDRDQFLKVNKFERSLTDTNHGSNSSTTKSARAASKSAEEQTFTQKKYRRASSITMGSKANTKMAQQKQARREWNGRVSNNE